MRALLVLVAATALLTSCGGDGDRVDSDPRPPGATPTADFTVGESVEPAALAFIDSSLGSILAVSVAPNEAGLEWIDVALGANDVVTSVTAGTTEGLIAIELTDSAATITAPAHDLTISGETSGSEVTVISGGDVATYDLGPGATGYRLPRPLVGLQPIGFDATSPSEGWPVPQEEPNPLEYLVDRPTHVTARVTVDVVLNADGEVVDLVGTRDWFGLTQRCDGDFAERVDVQVFCGTHQNQVSITARVTLPPAANWKEEHLGVFASRERCEAWSSLNGFVGNLNNWVGSVASADAGLAVPQIGLALTATTAVMSNVFSRTSGVPCATITVADELIAEHLEANADLAVNLEVGALARGHEFTSASLEIRPFSSEPAARSLVLSGTRIDGQPDQADDAENGESRSDVDGVYRLDSLLDSIEVGVDGGTVLEDGLELRVEDGVVVRFSGGYRLDNTATETGSQDRVLCRSDVTLDLELTEAVELVSGRGEGPLVWLATQSFGRPTSVNNSGECDPDLAGEQRFPLTARFEISDGVATVDFLSDGASLTTLTLAK